jgi:hypothetical protein
MALPLMNFEMVETDIDFVNSDVKFANRCSVVVRVMWKAMILTAVLGQLVEKQKELISELNDAPLAVEAQEVVPFQAGSADWGIEVEASMWAVEVIVVQPGVEVLFSFC